MTKVSGWQSKIYVGDRCPSCEGKGRYEGLRKVEDPCEECGGDGMVNMEELKPYSPDTVGLVATTSQDRDGDLIDPDGLSTDNYRSSPVIEWVRVDFSEAHKERVDGDVSVSGQLVTGEDDEQDR